MQHKLCNQEIPMLTERSFPQKLALGKNFCNRIKEQEHLKNQIIDVRPTLIISPRRYGKTSLGIQVLENLQIPYVHLDLFPLATVEDVENTIMGGIGEIIALCENTPEKALKAISAFFTALSIGFNIVNTKVQVSITKEKVRPQALLNALQSVDELLQKKKKNAVLFLDEFQRLAQMPGSEQIEGAIRFVAQQSKNLSFLFSGSNRHLLEKMFSDSHRPLYKLCDRLTLERIDRNEYVPFIQKQAQQTWKQKLEIHAIEAIFECTDCHPYYVNTLCHRLWTEKNIFNSKKVIDTWDDYALGEKSTVLREIENLSENQIKMLISLARYGATESILNDAFLNFSRMALSSAKQSIVALEKKDFVYRCRNNKYCVLDPLVKYILCGRK